MEIMAWVERAVYDIAGGALGAGVLFWLSKAWLMTRIQESVKHEYARGLETHKAQLKRDSDIELEQQRASAGRQLEELKSALAVAATSRNVAFSNIYERRVNAIAAIHGPLVEVNRRLGAYIAMFELPGMGTHDDRVKKLAEAFETFEGSYLQHNIFLPKPVADQLTRLRASHVTISNFFRLRVHGQPPSGETGDAWAKLVIQFEGEVKELMDEVEKAMRDLLGDVSVTRVEATAAPAFSNR